MAATEPFAFVPLTHAVPDWPSQLFGEVDFLDEVGVSDFRVQEGKDLLKVTGTVAWLREIAFDIPGMDGLSIAFLSANGYTAIPFEVDVLPDLRVALPSLSASIRFRTDLLRPVRLEAGRWVPALDATGKPKPAEVELSGVGIAADVRGNVEILLPTGAPRLSLGAVEIGDTGLVLEIDGVSPYLSREQPPPAGAPPGFRGISIDSVKLHLPKDLDVPIVPSDLDFEHMLIGTGGFSGKVTGTWTPSFANGKFSGNGSGELFGIPFALRSLSLEFKQNVPSATEIQGELVLPFFDHRVGVDLGLAVDGDFHVALSAVQTSGQASDGLVTLKKPGLFSLELDSVGFETHEGVAAVKVSGKLTPDIGDLHWPTFEVKDLTIDSKGNVRVAGGWLDLPSGFALDFHAFKLEISKIGFGRTDDGWSWIGFSGGLKLVEGLPAGASVEGLRVAWKEGEPHPRVTLNGVGLEFKVPGAVSFAGHVSYGESIDPVDQAIVHRFDGDIELNLESIGLEIDAVLVIGSAAPPAGSPYTFFAIYIGLELPVGIPLGQTSLAFYGAAGLFALNMEPNRLADEPWYGVGPTDGWYHRGKVGVTDLRTKWGNRRGSLALGGGVTLGTLSDNGYTFAGKVLLVLILPGPILMIEGKANLLKERSKLSDEPLFRVLAILDARAGLMQIGIDAKYVTGDQGEMLDIAGGAEALYRFSDPTAWHIWVGEKEPREKRIHASIFRLFEATAYMMLDAHQFEAGAWIGFNKHWGFGPVALTLEAWIECHTLLSVKPPQFNAELWLHGKAALSAFGFAVAVSADALITAEVFHPYHLKGDFSVALDLPWPLPDFSAKKVLEWGPEPTPPLVPFALKEVAIAHFKSTTTWPLERGTLLRPTYDSEVPGMLDDSPPNPAAQVAAPPPPNAPIVPLDARPQVTFGRNVNDDAEVATVVQPVTPEWEVIGDPTKAQGQVNARYAVTRVALERYDGAAWQPVASSSAGNLYGSWAPLPTLPDAPESAPGQTKLWLWSRSTFDYTRNVSSAWDEWFTDRFPDYPCIPTAPDRTLCVDFDAVPPTVALQSPYTAPGDTQFMLSWPGAAALRTIDLTLAVEGHARALWLPDGELSIALAEPAKSITLLVGDPPAVPSRSCVDYRKRRAGSIANPGRASGATVEVRGADGKALADATIVSIGPKGQKVGALDCGREVQIALPCPAREVELTLRTTSDRVRADARDADGRHVDTARMTVRGAVPETLVLNGEGIRIVSITAPGDETQLLRFCFTCDRPARLAEATARGVGGAEYGPVAATGGSIELAGAEIDQVVVTGADGVRLVRVCANVGPDPDDVTRRTEMAEHNRSASAVWSDTGEVLAPNTSYRLAIDTKVETKDFPYDPSFNRARTQTTYSYFRTQGPPGLTTLSTPAGYPEPDHFKSGLDTLDRYVRQTVPPTVPPPGERPVLPRPVYRAYDIGVEFNESYVDLMYRIDRRDLGLYLYDANAKPLRDAQGRLIVLSNEWGETEKLTLTESEQRFVEVAGRGNCVIIDEAGIPHDRTLTSAAEGQVLAADVVYEARLVPLLLHEDFAAHAGYTIGQTASGGGAKLGAWAVVDGGTNGTPSHWEIGQAGSPPARHVKQTASIWGGTRDLDDAAKPGTLLVGGDTGWTDYRFSVFVRSSSGSALGVAFRYADASNHYRYSMDLSGRRRLVRVFGGQTTVLAEDRAGFDLNRDYLVTVEAVSAEIAVYQDGAPVFAVREASFANGRIALYTWDNPGARFADVRVDDFSKTAPTVYSFRFTTSRFADFFHQLGSYDDETWRLALPDAAAQDAPVAAALSAAVPATSAPTDAEARAYDVLAVGGLGSAARQQPASIEVGRLERSGAALGLLVRSPEPIDWARTALAVWRGPTGGRPPIAPGAIKLTQASVGAANPEDEWAEVLLREEFDPTGATIEQLVAPGPMAIPSGPAIELHDDFRGRPAGLLHDETFGVNTLDRYEIVDLGNQLGPSAWGLSSGAIVQTADVYGGSVAAADAAKPGTVALLRDVAAGDVRVRVRLRSNDDDGIGVALRWGADGSHYRFSMDRERSFRRLVKVAANGAATVLWQDAVAYAAGRAYDLELACRGQQLVAYLDGVLLFAVTDTEVLAGERVGLYAWANSDARFERLTVETQEVDPIAWAPRLDDMTELGVVDAGGGASQWTAQAGVVLQSQPVGAPGAQQRGTYAVGGDAEWSDVTITTRLSTSAGGAAGVMLRYLDDDNHYRFSIGPGAAGAQLIRKKGGAARVLWQGRPRMAANKLRRITLTAVGARISAYLDGRRLFEVWDTGLDHGRVALHSWRSSSRFAGLTVTDRSRRIGGLLIRDESPQGAPSVWRRELGALSQTTPVGSGAGAAARGTVAIAGDSTWTDYRVTARVRSDGSGAVGLVLRHLDGDNHYFLSIDTSERRLVKRHNGNTSTLRQQATGLLADESFDVIIDAVGPHIVGHVGEERVFDVVDSDLPAGGVGLYAQATAGAHFERLDVEPPPLEAYLRANGAGLTDLAVTATLKVGAGANELRFRFADKDNHYLLSFDSTKRERRLVKVTGGVPTTLWQDAIAYSRGQQLAVAVAAIGPSLMGFVDGAPMFAVEDHDHAAGRVTAKPSPRFSDVRIYDGRVSASNRLLHDDFAELVAGRWRFVDDGNTEAPSAWTVAGGELVQTRGIRGAGAARPGTCALAGDESWDDYRLVVRLRLEAAGTVGAIVRHVEGNGYYRVSIDSKGGTVRLVKSLDGAVTTLWQGKHAMSLKRDYLLTIDCLGDRIVVYLDAVRLCEVRDASLPRGAIGLYTFATGGAHFGAVTVIPASWTRYHRFGGEGRLAAGTRLRVYSGRLANLPSGPAGVQQRSTVTVGEQVRFPASGVRLRVGGHERDFLASSGYTAVSVKVLRSADGTGLVVVPASGGPLSAGDYRLAFTYRRDNRAADPHSVVLREAGSSSDEEAQIDVPWSTVR